MRGVSGLGVERRVWWKMMRRWWRLEGRKAGGKGETSTRGERLVGVSGGKCGIGGDGGLERSRGGDGGLEGSRGGERLI